MIGHSMSTESLTQNASSLLAFAETTASSRHHPHIGTEHVLYALFSTNEPNPTPSIVTWLLETGKVASKDAVLKTLESFEFFQPQPDTDFSIESPLPRSASLKAILAIAKIVAGRHPITTESIATAMLLHRHNVASDVLRVCSEEKISEKLIKEMSLQPEALLASIREKMGTLAALGPLSEFVLPDAAENSDDKEAKADEIQLPSLDELNQKIQHDKQVFQGPTKGSNWLIPGHVIMGAWPSGRRDGKPILEAGTRVFVCLVGECDVDELKQMYPADFRRILTASGKDDPLRVLHLPIPDFEILDNESTFELVERIVRLVKKGKVVYIHCYGGHGRTGFCVDFFLLEFFEFFEKSIDFCFSESQLR
jgi:hypothetical protein